MIFGGSRRGLMGIAAAAAMTAGGEVIGVMPRFLVEPERANHDITELRLVERLAARKELIAELSDAFVCLPGGIGTLDELLEMVTTFDLRLHAKPTFLCDIDGFWQPSDALIDPFYHRGVMRPTIRESYRRVPDVSAAMAALDAHFAAR